LHGISWETYERLLAEHQESSGTHFTYDRGRLEIMVLSAKHEAAKHVLTLLVEILAEELNVDVYGLGSTTFRRADLERGFEPDACFYIQREALVRGKDEIDLTVDPPPDLVIEIDITSPSLNKFPLFAALGISESGGTTARGEASLDLRMASIASARKAARCQRSRARSSPRLLRKINS